MKKVISIAACFGFMLSMAAEASRYDRCTYRDNGTRAKRDLETLTDSASDLMSEEEIRHFMKELKSRAK